MLDKVRELTEKGVSQNKIAELLGISRHKVNSIVRENGFEKNKVELNQTQYEILIGTIIGDGSLFGGDGENRNFRMNLAHSLKQEKYFMYKYDQLKELVKSNPKKRSWIDKRNGQTYSEIRLQTRANKFFNRLYGVWYKEKKKIIPLDPLMKCGEMTLAIKYFDDGYKNSYGHYAIAMNDYDDESIENMRFWMKERFGINSTIHKGKRIYIPAESKAKMLGILKLIPVEDLEYKI